jgi:hypothetical protein
VSSGPTSRCSPSTVMPYPESTAGSSQTADGRQSAWSPSGAGS